MVPSFVLNSSANKIKPRAILAMVSPTCTVANIEVEYWSPGPRPKSTKRASLPAQTESELSVQGTL